MYNYRGGAMKNQKKDATIKSQYKKEFRLYTLDGNLDIADSSPIDSLDQNIPFHDKRYYRFFLTERKDGDVPYVDIFITEDGTNTLVFHFCEDASSSQLARFWDYVHKLVIIDNMADRWGNIQVEWGGPDSATGFSGNILTIYHEEDTESIAFAFLRLNSALSTDSKTYNDLIADYEYILKLFESAQQENTGNK